jgi:hypothetical protein
MPVDAHPGEGFERNAPTRFETLDRMDQCLVRKLPDVAAFEIAATALTGLVGRKAVGKRAIVIEQLPPGLRGTMLDVSAPSRRFYAFGAKQ